MMKKQMLNLGVILSKQEQKTVQGGSIYRCGSNVPPATCQRKCREYTQNRDCVRLRNECRVNIKCTNLDDEILV